MRSRALSCLTPALLGCVLAQTSWADLTAYSEDFEGLVQADGAALGNAGWLVFANVFDGGGGFVYNYGPFAAPNGGPGFCAVATGEGGPPQGAQQLVTYSDYNNGDHGNGFLIETNVFQEQIVGAVDIGRTYTFTFDAKLGDLQPNSTAFAFIKVIDSNTFGLDAFETIEMTTTPGTWSTYSISLTIDPAFENDFFQIGFLTNATQFTPSGIVYDNINFAEDAGCSSNDDCACAEEISGNGTFAFDSTNATTDGAGDPLCDKFGTSQIENDVWFAWTPDESCDYTVSTCNMTDVDTKIAIYDGADCATSVIVDCNDDAASGLCGLTSEVFAGGLLSGETYLIRIGTFPGASGGTGEFSISKANCMADSNDDCADCTEISGTGTFDFDNTFATTDGAGDPLCDKFGTSQIENDVWFCWTPSCNGDYTVSTCNMTDVDTKIAIYDGADCVNSAIIDCNDDAASGLCGLTSEVFGNGLVGGETYLIRIGTFPGASGGVGQFSITGPDFGGTNYCVAGVNQDGEMASIGFNGTPSVSDNNFELVTNGVSSLSRFGLYVMGANQDQIPFQQGFLCIALDSTFNRLNPILQYSNVDQVSRVVDLTAPPADVITGGSTWNFQLWYRDTGETNLSDALSVCFAP